MYKFKALMSLRVKFISFDVPKDAVKKLGEKFCNYFIRDNDRFLFYKDKYAKYFLIDWKKLEKNEFPFIQPKLFPFYITHLDVLIDENYDIYHKNKKITTKDVYKLENEYKKSLIPVIDKKNKIYNAFIADLEKKYFRTKKFLENMNLWDYNLEAHIEFFDIGDCIIFEECMNYETFDASSCSLSLYGLDMQVNFLLWRLIDAFGLRIVTAKIYIWSEIKTDLQMSYLI